MSSFPASYDRRGPYRILRRETRLGVETVVARGEEIVYRAGAGWSFRLRREANDWIRELSPLRGTRTLPRSTTMRV